MARYTSSSSAPAPVRKSEKNGSVVRAAKTADAVTGEGGPAFTYKDKAELFLLGVANFTGQQTYYESGADRDSRFITLIHTVAKKDPAFVAQFLLWLRSHANIRTASLVGAIEYGRTVSGTTLPDEITPRAVLRSVLQRADEPSEALGYWLSTYGRHTPRWFQRAIGDGANRLYTEHSVLKYDSQKAKIRFGDVINLSSVKTMGYKAEVFRFALDRRYDNVQVDDYPELKMLQVRTLVDDVVQADRAAFLEENPQVLTEAGYSWESLAGWLGGPLTQQFWEALIPGMGYMALLRNLRNFAKAGISTQAAQLVADRIADTEQVIRSRQLPLRFLSAYRAIQPASESGSSFDSWNLTRADDTFASEAGRALANLWVPALDQALSTSLASVPVLEGQSVIMVDCSASMHQMMSDKSTVTYYEHAVAFGVALALRNPGAILYGYSTTHQEIKLVRGGSLLDNIEAFQRQFPCRGGTKTVDTAEMVMTANKSAQRLIIVTDEQSTHAGSDLWGRRSSGKTLVDAVPTTVTCVTFNVAGYQLGHAPAGRDNFYTVPALTDAGFQMLAMLESIGQNSWPWEPAQV